MYAYDSHGSGDSFINRLDMYLIAPKIIDWLGGRFAFGFNVIVRNDWEFPLVKANSPVILMMWSRD